MFKNAKAHLVNVVTLGLVIACLTRLSDAQTTKTITVSATASHPVPSTMCEYFLVEGNQKLTLVRLGSWANVRGLLLNSLSVLDSGANVSSSV